MAMLLVRNIWQPRHAGLAIGRVLPRTWAWDLSLMPLAMALVRDLPARLIPPFLAMAC